MTAMDPIIILPGLLCDSRMFGAQIRDLGASVVDGFYGEADSFGAMARYALDRMPARCLLIGHSMGARVALEIWRTAPERIAGLVLVDTGTHPVRADEPAKRQRLIDLGRQHGSEALVADWLPPMISPSRSDDPALYETLREMAVDAGIDTYERQVRALLTRSDGTLVLPTITCPTLVAVGEDDLWAPVAQHEAIVAAIPGAALRILEAAGHMAPAEQPAAFNAMLREWLETI